MMTADETLSRARRLDEFLRDEIVSSALSRMERQYYEEFKRAKGSDDRVIAYAKAHVLDQFLNELRTVASAGEAVTLQPTRKA
jgi:hypothetical protein